jgi:glycosyltransferase involved in cell wall biosynthesis
MMYPFTAHILVRNEDKFLKYALQSVLPFVSNYIIYDTGSTDKTLEILKDYRHEQRELQTSAGLTQLRNEMIDKTKTDWLFLLDGDEVWNTHTLKKYLEFTLGQPKNILATFLKTRNCVGDIYHYRETGQYEIAGIKGSLNIRAYRKTVKWQGEYPLEKCVDTTAKKSLAYFDGFYWHMTHLQRSSSEDLVMGFRRKIFDLGIEAKMDELPEVFSKESFPRRSKIYEIISAGAEIVRKIK